MCHYTITNTGMNPVPSIVYSHPIKELPTIPNSVSTYSFDRLAPLQGASLLNTPSGRNSTPERAEFVPLSSSAKPEWIALSSNAKTDSNANRIQLPVNRAPSKPKRPDPVPPKDSPEPHKRNMDDYLFEFYIGSVSIVGLFILFRVLQKKGT